MFLNIKILLSVITMILISFACANILFKDLMVGFFLLISIFLIMFGDILIGYKVAPFKPLFEPTPKGMELMELQLLDGRVHYINTEKGPQGKRSFYMNGHDASVINDGKSQMRVAGGNIGFRAHELIDMNIDPKRCKALEKMPGENIKELYYIGKQLEGKHNG